ncbi:MAG: replicative DNA helicase [Oscillospiraceae bacterium]|nr:replicative DNA helicase [Oscillospiraceae bacterium]MDE6777064.1 replicative DNA helicase [Oscillospiraceae bacterium]
MLDFSDLAMPYSLEAEQTILGGILINPDVMEIVMERVKPECFYIEQHQKLFKIFVQMLGSGSHIDIITVLNEAVSAHVFETASDGRTYLANIAESVPSIANIKSYCKIVVNRYYVRMLAETCRETLNAIQEGEIDAQVLLDAVEQNIFNIRQNRNIGGLTPLKEIITEAYIHIGHIAGPDREQYLGIHSGFPHLDTVISGLNKSDLILVAARPAMGKTAFALNIAQNVAKTNPDKEVCIFSLEMSKEQLATRFLSSAAQVDSNKLRNGRIVGNEWTRLAIGTNYLSNMPVYIDDTGGITVPQMKAKLRRMKNLSLVIIDYLGLISSTMRTENKVQIVGEITRQLKIMAKELEVPVLLLSQLSRGPESRTDKRPLLSDLRDSGAIEQDADIVMFLYRDAYYHKDTEKPNVAECIIAKNRHGETGTIELIWDGQFTRFSEMGNPNVMP